MSLKVYRDQAAPTPSYQYDPPRQFQIPGRVENAANNILNAEPAPLKENTRESINPSDIVSSPLFRRSSDSSKATIKFTLTNS